VAGVRITSLNARWPVTSSALTVGRSGGLISIGSLQPQLHCRQVLSWVRSARSPFTSLGLLDGFFDSPPALVHERRARCGFLVRDGPGGNHSGRADRLR
jgi:hypothetical protein